MELSKPKPTGGGPPKQQKAASVSDVLDVLEKLDEAIRETKERLDEELVGVGVLLGDYCSGGPTSSFAEEQREGPGSDGQQKFFDGEDDEVPDDCQEISQVPSSESSPDEVGGEASLEEALRTAEALFNDGVPPMDIDFEPSSDESSLPQEMGEEVQLVEEGLEIKKADAATFKDEITVLPAANKHVEDTTSNTANDYTMSLRLASLLFDDVNDDQNLIEGKRAELPLPSSSPLMVKENRLAREDWANEEFRILISRTSMLLDVVYGGQNLSNEMKRLRAIKILERYEDREEVLLATLEKKAAAKWNEPSLVPKWTTPTRDNMEGYTYKKKKSTKNLPRKGILHALQKKILRIMHAKGSGQDIITAPTGSTLSQSVSFESLVGSDSSSTYEGKSAQMQGCLTPPRWALGQRSEC